MGSTTGPEQYRIENGRVHGREGDYLILIHEKGAPA